MEEQYIGVINGERRADLRAACRPESRRSKPLFHLNARKKRVGSELGSLPAELWGKA